MFLNATILCFEQGLKAFKFLIKRLEDRLSRC